MRKNHLIRIKILILTVSGFLLIFLSGSSIPFHTVSSAPAAQTEETVSEVFFVTEPSGEPAEWDSPSSLNSILRLSETEDGTDGEGAAEQAAAERIIGSLESAFSNISHALSSLDQSKGEYYEPSVIKYNLMALYPEETEPASRDSTDSAQKEQLMMLMKQRLRPLYELFSLSFHTGASSSYGGQMYEYLSRKDAGWASGIYKWLQSSPEQAAKMMGRSPASVLGSYDPTNEKHDPADPGTWLVPSWKNVNFQFYDGDGRPISLRSNTQEIISMASVYTYYTGWEDVDQFRAFADYLWELSHSFQASMGEVYYCDGCTAPDKAQETALNPSEGEAAGIPQEGAADGVTEPSESAAQEDGTNQAGSAAQSGSTVQTSGQGEAASQRAHEQAQQPESQTSGNLPQDASSGTAEPSGTADAAASPSELPVQAGNFTAVSGQTADGASLSSTDPDTSASVITPEVKLNAEGKFCPGHVDLTVTGRIIGLSERKNLFSLDRRGSEKTEDWNGWSPYNAAYVRQLSGQDWSVKYGLTPLELALGVPLSLTEINQYLSLLPADISAERRAVISYALHTVGKVPYYYGGKAKAPGFEGNSFASLTLPDKKGRVLSGLDCSGWVNWVYWSALGQQPTHLGTSGLIHAGTAISRSELKPGDIIVRLGANSHVMMFLAWAPNGSMICVHETGGSVSNVTVSTSSANWPHYRSLLD